MIHSYKQALEFFQTARNKTKGKPVTGSHTRLYLRDDGVLWVGYKDEKSYKTLSLEIHPDDTIRIQVLTEKSGGEVQRVGNALHKFAQARFWLTWPRRAAKRSHTFQWQTNFEVPQITWNKLEFGTWIHFSLTDRKVVAQDSPNVRQDDLEHRLELQRSLRKARDQFLIRFDLGLLNNVEQVQTDVRERQATSINAAELFDRMAESTDITYADCIALLAIQNGYWAWYRIDAEALRHKIAALFKSDATRRAYFEAKGAYTWVPMKEAA